MGYMTTVTILNDCWTTIKENPEELINQIEAGMDGIDDVYNYRSKSNVNEYAIGNCSNPISVCKSFHADDCKILYVGQNLMTDLTEFRPENKRMIEIQLGRIQQAKAMLDYSEKHLKELLKEERL